MGKLLFENCLSENDENSKLFKKVFYIFSILTLILFMLFIVFLIISNTTRNNAFTIFSIICFVGYIITGIFAFDFSPLMYPYLFVFDDRIVVKHKFGKEKTYDLNPSMYRIIVQNNNKHFTKYGVTLIFATDEKILFRHKTLDLFYEKDAKWLNELNSIGSKIEQV